MNDFSVLNLFISHEKLKKGIICAYNYKYYSLNNNFPIELHKKKMEEFIIKQLNFKNIDYNTINPRIKFVFNDNKTRLYYSKDISPYYIKYNNTTPLNVFLIFNDSSYKEGSNILKITGEEALQKYNLIKTKYPKFAESLDNDKNFVDLISALESLINSGYDTIITYQPLQLIKPSLAYKTLKEEII